MRLHVPTMQCVKASVSILNSNEDLSIVILELVSMSLVSCRCRSQLKIHTLELESDGFLYR